MKYNEFYRDKAEELLEALNRGYYTVPFNGRLLKVDIGDYKPAVAITENDLNNLIINPIGTCRNITITANSAIDDIISISNQYRNTKIGVLNFASAHNPGGGFINGAMAQEEALCQASTLYLQLKDCDVYKMHSVSRDGIYTDNMAICETKFIRDSKYNYLINKVNCTVITSAAVNNRRIKDPDSERVRRVMYKRMENVLKLFIANDVKVVILGAFGCGVFGNNAEFVATAWKDLLLKYGAYFDEVVFSVMSSKKKDNYSIFKKCFK